MDQRAKWLGMAVLMAAAPGTAVAHGRCPQAVSAQSAAERVRLLQSLALDQAGLSAPLASAGRLRAAALLPRVSVSLGATEQTSTQSATTTSTSALVSDPADPTLPWRTGQRLSLQLGLRWDLSTLVYHPRELQVRRQQQHEAQAATALSREVAKLYFERRRLLGEVGGSAERLAVLTAELEGMTGFCGLVEADRAPASDP